MPAQVFIVDARILWAGPWSVWTGRNRSIPAGPLQAAFACFLRYLISRNPRKKGIKEFFDPFCRIKWERVGGSGNLARSTVMFSAGLGAMTLTVAPRSIAGSIFTIAAGLLHRSGRLRRQQRRGSNACTGAGLDYRQRTLCSAISRQRSNPGITRCLRRANGLSMRAGTSVTQPNSQSLHFRPMPEQRNAGSSTTDASNSGSTTLRAAPETRRR
jgi:hypothetical protein